MRKKKLLTRAVTLALLLGTPYSSVFAIEKTPPHMNTNVFKETYTDNTLNDTGIILAASEAVTTTISSDVTYSEDTVVNVNDTTITESGSAISGQKNDVTVTLQNGAKLDITSNVQSNGTGTNQAGAIFTNNGHKITITGDGELSLTVVTNEKYGPDSKQDQNSWKQFGVVTNKADEVIKFDVKSVTISDNGDKSLRGGFNVNDNGKIEFTDKVEKLTVNFTNDEGKTVMGNGQQRYLVSVGKDAEFVYGNENGEIDLNLKNTDAFFLSGGTVTLDGKLTDIEITENNKATSTTLGSFSHFLVYINEPSSTGGESKINFNADMTKVIADSGVNVNEGATRSTVTFNGNADLTFNSSIDKSYAGSLGNLRNTDLVFNGAETIIETQNTNSNLSTHYGLLLDNHASATAANKTASSNLTSKNDFSLIHKDNAKSSTAIRTMSKFNDDREAGNKLSFENAVIQNINDNENATSSTGVLLETKAELSATGNFNVLASTTGKDGAAYALHVNDGDNAHKSVNLTGISNTFTAIGKSGAAVLIKNTTADIGSNATKQNVFQGGMAIDEDGNVSGSGVKAINALNGTRLNLMATETIVSGDVVVDSSQMTVKTNSGLMNGQLLVTGGSSVSYENLNDNTGNMLVFAAKDKDVMNLYSDKDSVSSASFKEATLINAHDDFKYYAGVTDKTKGAAIRAKQNSEVTLEKAAGIYGDIIAVGAENKTGGKVTVNSVNAAGFAGDVIAGNGGEISLTLNGSSQYEGRIDDYSSGVYSKNTDNIGVKVNDNGKVSLTLNDSSWKTRGQNFVTDLSLKNGIVDMTTDDKASVTVGNLSGDGIVKMNLDAENRANGDMLYVTGTHSGTQTIDVNWLNDTEIAGIADGERIRFATTNGSGSGFTAQTRDTGFFNVKYDTITEAYDAVNEKDENTEYNGDGNSASNKPGNDYVDSVFKENGINHYIVGINQDESEVSDAGKTIINMSKVNYNNAVYMDRLNKRLGEARYISPEDEQGMWVRIRHDRIGKDDAFRSQNTMYEMGYDEKQECDNGERRVGFAIDYMDGKAEYTGIAGSGDVKRYGLWLYDTWMGDKGHYADYVAKWGHLENDFDIMARSTGEKITGDYSNNVFSVSAEYGRKKDIGNNWYFEPQAQLQLARVTGADYTTSQGTRVSLDGINSLIGRAGFRLGRDVDERSTVYVKADLLHEFLGEQDMHVVDNTFNGSQTFENKGTWYDVGFGFATALGKGSYAFMDFEKSFGNDNDETYQINAGVQWAF